MGKLRFREGDKLGDKVVRSVEFSFLSFGYVLFIVYFCFFLDSWF